MSEYIEREALRDALYEADAITMKGVAIINQFPAADVAPVVHGRWESVCGCIVRCNSCGGEAARKSNYCPNCGALMDLDGKDEDNV